MTRAPAFDTHRSRFNVAILSKQYRLPRVFLFLDTFGDEGGDCVEGCAVGVYACACVTNGGGGVDEEDFGKEGNIF